MLAKYINEHLIIRQRKGEIIYVNDKQIINPKDEDYIKLGYKELIIEEMPTYNGETEYIEIFYELKDNKIYGHYEIKKIEVKCQT